MNLPVKKTKIVCTIGPACRSKETLEQMIINGMNVARLNFAHGDFESHKELIKLVNEYAELKPNFSPTALVKDLLIEALRAKIAEIKAE